MHRLTALAIAAATLAQVNGEAAAQAGIKPPQAQVWIDVATFSGMGMPMGGMPGGAGGALSALGGMFGGGGAGGGAKNSFGHTQDAAAGRWVDVTLSTRNNPSLSEAQQAVPAGFLSPALKLQAPQGVKPPPEVDEEKVLEPTHDKPKGRLLLYWGCGAAVRAGQPKVLDLASASATDLTNFFVTRRATQRGTHSASGRPGWPSPPDTRMVPANASLVGEHAFSGVGVPDGFRFQISAPQDMMPALQVQQTDQSGATQLAWAAVPTARAYFVAGMGAAKQDETVIWTSSELPETGSGLIDYQTNAAVDRWARERVLLLPTTTQCTVPKEVFPGGGAMLRVIAYGSELNLAQPPRPADPKAPWEPVWAAKVRVKSVASVVLGMPSMSEPPASGADAAQQPEPPEKKLKPLDLLKGILGR